MLLALSGELAGLLAQNHDDFQRSKPREPKEQSDQLIPCFYERAFDGTLANPQISSDFICDYCRIGLDWSTDPTKEYWLSLNLLSGILTDKNRD
jgi:hypothetical protein